MHFLEVWRVRRAHHAQTPAFEWIDQLGDQVRARTHAEPPAQAQQISKPRSEHCGRRERDALIVERVLRLREIRARHDSELAEHICAGDAAVAVQRAVHQHRHAEALQQQRQQRQQIRLMACTAVTRQEHRLRFAARGAQPEQALVERVEKTDQLGQRFRPHAQRKQDCAKLELRHAAVEHRAEQLISVLLRQLAGAFRAAADFLDVMSEGHKVVVSG